MGQGVDNILERLGLGQHVGDAHLAGTFGRLRTDPAREYDHGELGVALPYSPKHFETIHAGHDEIEKDRVRPHLFQDREALFAPTCDDDLVAGALKRLGERTGNDRLVVDDEDQHGQGTTPRIISGFAALVNIVRM